MKLISAREAAQRLGKNFSTIYRMAYRQEIEAQMVEVKRLRVLWDEEKGCLVPKQKGRAVKQKKLRKP